MRKILELINRFKDFLLDIKSSYWFLPTLITVAAFLLAFATVIIDQSLSAKNLNDFGLLYLTSAEGARAILSTIAGSVMTVAGVTFSMTLLSVSHASSEIGPRILSGFMKDRGTQLTLGVFAATFAYCIMILRTVHGVPINGSTDDLFVPHISILISILLALISVFVLIFFIHHVTQVISKSAAVERIGEQLLKKIEIIFQKKDEKINNLDIDKVYQTIKSFNDSKIPITIEDQGYFRMMQEEELLNIAIENDIIIESVNHPGDYLYPKIPLAYVSKAKKADQEILNKKIKSSFFRGVKRTTNQDLFFPVDLLVEIATRALSPGVNDPFTAVECINQLMVGLIKIDTKAPPLRYIFDDKNTLRMIKPPVNSSIYLDRFCDQLRLYAKADIITSRHLIRSLTKAKAVVKNDELKKSIEDQIGYLSKCLFEGHGCGRDLQIIRESMSLESKH